MNMPRNRILLGDARNILPTLPSGSVDCVITSPPYFALRNYQTANQIGLEPSVDDWVAQLRTIVRELGRVLAPHGSLWLNLGDTYSREPRTGAAPKSLLLGPERLALAMVDDGWTIRNKIIWAKTNPMPTSVRDRLACSWEVIYFAVRSRDYFFDLDAIRVPHRSSLREPSRAALRRAARSTTRPAWSGPLAGSNIGLDKLKACGLVGHALGKNPGDIWTMATSSHRGMHHAMFPERLIDRPLLGTCPERVCTDCGQPWRRERTRQLGHLAVVGELRPTCRCGVQWRRGFVLDPFMGAGTVAVVAEKCERDWVGIEINREFVALAEQRIGAERQKRGDEGTAADAA